MNVELKDPQPDAEYRFDLHGVNTRSLTVFWFTVASGFATSMKFFLGDHIERDLSLMIIVVSAFYFAFHYYNALRWWPLAMVWAFIGGAAIYQNHAPHIFGIFPLLLVVNIFAIFHFMTVKQEEAKSALGDRDRLRIEFGDYGLHPEKLAFHQHSTKIIYEKIAALEAEILYLRNEIFHKK